VREVGRLLVATEFPDGRVGYYRRQQLEHIRGPASNQADFGLNGIRIPIGGHACLLPSSDKEAVDVGAHYLAAGLRHDERCVCALPLGRMEEFREAAHRLSAGEGSVPWERLTLMDVREVYLPAGSFVGERQAERLAELIRSAVDGEGEQCRVFGCMGQMLSELDLTEWWEYEQRVTPVCQELQTTAVCAYEPRGEGTAMWRRAAEVHPYIMTQGQLLEGRGSPGP
jgi:hypothetical protein